MANKLTLSADDEVIALAKRLAAEQHTSVSALFAQFVRSMGRKRPTPISQRETPVLRRLRGSISVPHGKSDRELLEEALLERHR